MAAVEVVSSFECLNLNVQKFEKLLHMFFAESCLEVGVTDHDGQNHRPREWFIAPTSVIDAAVRMIISGDIVNYEYDASQCDIVPKN